MSDPYKVLNISPNASDDEVKRAYRELARKYHPDNYHDNPLADLAQEKMKEINEAYEQVQKQRKTQAAYGSPQGAYSYGGASSYAGSSSADPLMQRVRAAINSGDITLAERLLNEAQEHGAEWSFLMGVVCMRRGWMDEAKQYLQTACRMEPDNAEYRQAMQLFDNSGYQPAGYRGFGSMTFGDDACMRLCAGYACFSATGCPIFCCI
jgi:curved DNA-binding protein CbpA